MQELEYVRAVNSDARFKEAKMISTTRCIRRTGSPPNKQRRRRIGRRRPRSWHIPASPRISMRGRRGFNNSVGTPDEVTCAEVLTMQVREFTQGADTAPTFATDQSIIAYLDDLVTTIEINAEAY